MNRINPLHIGILLFVLLGFLLFKLSEAKSEYREAKSSYKETLAIANELSGLKAVYADRSRSKKSLQKILRHTSLRSTEIEKNIKKSGISISAKSMDMKALNFLMGKLLNGTYQIEGIKIKQLSDTKVSLNVEIKW